MAKKCYWPVYMVQLPSGELFEIRLKTLQTQNLRLPNALQPRNFLICCDQKPKNLTTVEDCKKIAKELNKPNSLIFVQKFFKPGFRKLVNDQIPGDDTKDIVISSITFNDATEASKEHCKACDAIEADTQAWYNLFCFSDTEPSDPTPPTDPGHPVVTNPVPEPQPEQPTIPDTESRKITILNITHKDPCKSGSKTSILSSNEPVKPLIKSLSNISDLEYIKKRIWKHLDKNSDFYYREIFTDSDQFKFTPQQLEEYSKNVNIAEKKTYSFPNNQLIKTEKIKVSNPKHIKRGWVEQRPKKNKYSNFGLYIKYGLDIDRSFNEIKEKINAAHIGNDIIDTSTYKGLIKDALESDMVLPTEDRDQKSFFKIAFLDTTIFKIPIEFIIKAKPKLTGNIKLSLVCKGTDPSCDTGVIQQHKINLDKMTISETTIKITSSLQILYKIWGGEGKFDGITNSEYDILRLPDQTARTTISRFQSHNNLSGSNTPIGLIIFNENANDQIMEEIKNLFIPSPGGSWPNVPETELPIVFNPKIIKRIDDSTSPPKNIRTLIINGKDTGGIQNPNRSIGDIFIKSLHPNLLVPNNTTIEGYISEKYSGFIVQDEGNDKKNLRPNNKMPLVTDLSALFVSDMTNKDPTKAGPPGKNVQQQLRDMLRFEASGAIPFNIVPEIPKGSTSSTKYFTEILSKEIIDEIKRYLEFNVKEDEIGKKPCCCCYWTLDENQDELNYTLDIEKT